MEEMKDKTTTDIKNDKSSSVLKDMKSIDKLGYVDISEQTSNAIGLYQNRITQYFFAKEALYYEEKEKLKVKAGGVACVLLCVCSYYFYRHLFGTGVIILLVGLIFIIGLYSWKLKKLFNRHRYKTFSTEHICNISGGIVVGTRENFKLEIIDSRFMAQNKKIIVCIPVDFHDVYRQVDVHSKVYILEYEDHSFGCIPFNSYCHMFPKEINNKLFSCFNAYKKGIKKNIRYYIPDIRNYINVPYYTGVDALEIEHILTEDEKALYERKIGKIDEKDSYLAQIVLFESYEENRGEPLVLSYYQFENNNFCLKKCSEMIQKQKLVYGDKLLKVTCSSRMDFIVLDE